MNRLKLHTPPENELEYRRQLISDKATMEYNTSYGDDGDCTFRFDNHTKNDLNFMKKMIELQCRNE